MIVHFQESILYYDCEHIFVAVDDAGQGYIAVHESDYPTGCDYVVAPAPQPDLAAFKAGKIGLRSLLMSYPSREWYTLRLDVWDSQITLIKQPTPITEGWVDLLDEDYFVSTVDYSAVPTQVPARIPA